MSDNPPPNDIRVLGMHRLDISKEDFEEALRVQWGEGLDAEETARARAATQEHFDRLRLIEIQVHPPNASIDWDEFTQRIEGEPRDNWQVPWDETCVAADEGRWAFFLHCVDDKKTLVTPIGEIILPTPSPLPSHLLQIQYELPG